MPNLHPIFVHFAIGLFTAGVALDIAGYFSKRESLRFAGWWNLLIASFTALVAVITGLSAANTLPHTDQIHSIMEVHETLGLVALGLIIALFIWRSLNRGQIPSRLTVLYLTIGLATVGVMSFGAYYGGEMVYRHGMGVTPVMEGMMAEHEHGEHRHDGDIDDILDETGGTRYTCPMHPDVVSMEPGYCPKCGMALVMATADTSMSLENQASSESDTGGSISHIHRDDSVHEHKKDDSHTH